MHNALITSFARMWKWGTKQSMRHKEGEERQEAFKFYLVFLGLGADYMTLNPN